ncbi:PAS domain-containing sensor histidine kinase [Sulfurimonas autotrophica]|uniref:histidine kinase n=1 Tax=Sulfurimonas autotrophica (strain ATCC BAA-671 / DSM 16294 / JCM 11897 / OK10) TaxID=563040 RepID=E0UTR9_SULAO|nr:PAS domain-containing sensor histidine kinase [Sulfurimonas autotrophica]ADN08300.1 PAS/PAC sensor signal transduction histidine kinase [Sulfurimonas autotrophica DSM 16294]
MLEQYKEAIEKSNIISKTDVNGIITFVNDEFCKISGYSKEELIGKNHNIVRHPDVPASQFKALWETIKAKKTYKATVKNRAKNGSTFYVNTTVIPILDEKNNIEEFIAIRYDVTKEVFYKQSLEQKEKELEELNENLEKRVQEKTKELKELNETLELRVYEEIAKNEQKQKVMFWQSRLASLGEMLANIAHQWRQPLTELSLTLFSLKKAALQNNEKEVQSLYDESKLIIQNMSTTIDDFTNFFKPTKHKHYFKIAQSINESLSILEKIITKEMITIRTDFEDVEVLGISNELTQVMINLIQNSKDAFLQSGVLLKEINIRVKKEKEFAIIEFEDNAGGIKEKEIYKIFEPYFTTKHSSSGTGLGLFMSKMICEQGLNGSIDVKSKKGFTTFSIKIPLQDRDKANA